MCRFPFAYGGPSCSTKSGRSFCSACVPTALAPFPLLARGPCLTCQRYSSSVVRCRKSFSLFAASARRGKGVRGSLSVAEYECALSRELLLLSLELELWREQLEVKSCRKRRELGGTQVPLTMRSSRLIGSTIRRFEGGLWTGGVVGSQPSASSGTVGDRLLPSSFTSLAHLNVAAAGQLHREVRMLARRSARVGVPSLLRLAPLLRPQLSPAPPLPFETRGRVPRVGERSIFGLPTPSNEPLAGTIDGSGPPWLFLLQVFLGLPTLLWAYKVS